MIEWVKLLRIKHWIKNLLVLFPILFAQEAMDVDLLLVAIAGFFAFCFASSAIYVLNDLSDVESDRSHPTKKDRPLASGKVNKAAAIVVAVILLVASLVLTWLFAIQVVASMSCIVAYLILNILYSRGLKHVAVVDIAILSIGFVLRILYGGAVCDIPISAWLFLTTLALAIYLGLGKRLGELSRHGSVSRESLKEYTPEFLKRNMDIFMVCGLVFYSLWAIGRVDSLDLGYSLSSTLIIMSVPIAMFVLLRYNHSIARGDSDADPVNVIAHDGAILALIGSWCVVIAIALYV